MDNYGSHPSIPIIKSSEELNVLCERGEEPDEGWTGLTTCVAEIEDQGKIAIMNSDPGDVNELPNSLLRFLREMHVCGFRLDMNL